VRRLRRGGGRRGQDHHHVADGGHQRQRRRLCRGAQDRLHRGHGRDARRAGAALGRRPRQVRHRHGRRHRSRRGRGGHHLGPRVRRRRRPGPAHRGHRGSGTGRGAGRGTGGGGHPRGGDVRHALVRGRSLDPRQSRDARGGRGRRAAAELGRPAGHDHRPQGARPGVDPVPGRRRQPVRRDALRLGCGRRDRHRVRWHLDRRDQQSRVRRGPDLVHGSRPRARRVDGRREHLGGDRFAGGLPPGHGADVHHRLLGARHRQGRQPRDGGQARRLHHPGEGLPGRTLLPRRLPDVPLHRDPGARARLRADQARHHRRVRDPLGAGDELLPRHHGGDGRGGRGRRRAHRGLRHPDARGRQVRAGHPGLGQDRGRQDAAYHDLLGAQRHPGAGGRGHRRGGDGRLLLRMSSTTTLPAPQRDGAAGPPRRTVPPGRRLRRAAASWLLLAPGLLVLGVLLLWPMLRVLNLSLQDYELRNLLRGESDYVGLDNYVQVLSDPFLWKTVLPNTVGFALVCVVLTMVVGTVVALFLNPLGTTWRALCTTAIMVAWAVPALTGTYIFVWLFDPQSGLVISTLDGLGLMEAGSYNWFTNRWTFYAIATINVVYHGFPFIAVTMLAGLMTVPREHYEAAAIDGASAWGRFWNVTVPTLRPII